MELTRTRAAWRDLLERTRSSGREIGLVPTMGALHGGHLSLVEAASRRGHFVAMTIFVNPLQFGEAADLKAYPRDLDADLELASASGVDAVFAPSVEEMYPPGTGSTTVVPGPLASRYEGASRPSHFAGVATVVTKLFALAGPTVAFFGEKDFQQLAIVRQLVSDLELAVEVVGCPIVREPDGLAMSSRNRRLSPAERTEATALYRALVRGRRAIEEGEGPSGAERAMSELLSSSPGVALDYAAVVDPVTLEEPPEPLSGAVRLLVAAEVGPVRLIDNMAARPAASPIT